MKYIAKSMMQGKEMPQITRLENYEKENSKVLLDPLNTLKVLCDRNQLFSLLKDFKVSGGK